MRSGLMGGGLYVFVGAFDGPVWHFPFVTLLGDEEERLEQDV